jgi:hypothetical protein
MQKNNDPFARYNEETDLPPAPLPEVPPPKANRPSTSASRFASRNSRPNQSNLPEETRHQLPGLNSKRNRRFRPSIAHEEDVDAESDIADERIIKKKKLLKLLGAQALCLLIIFGSMSAWDWMSNIYSGEYMCFDPQLGNIKLYIDDENGSSGELSYHRVPLLKLEHGAITKDGPVALDFTSYELWSKQHKKTVRASFRGTVKGGKVSGKLVDARGIHEVKLEKNILSSIFRKLQGLMPSFQPPPHPSWVNTQDLEKRRNRRIEKLSPTTENRKKQPTNALREITKKEEGAGKSSPAPLTQESFP